MGTKIHKYISTKSADTLTTMAGHGRSSIGKHKIKIPTVKSSAFRFSSGSGSSTLVSADLKNKVIPAKKEHKIERNSTQMGRKSTSMWKKHISVKKAQKCEESAWMWSKAPECEEHTNMEHMRDLSFGWNQMTWDLR